MAETIGEVLQFSKRALPSEACCLLHVNRGWTSATTEACCGNDIDTQKPCDLNNKEKTCRHLYPLPKNKWKNSYGSMGKFTEKNGREKRFLNEVFNGKVLACHARGDERLLPIRFQARTLFTFTDKDKAEVKRMRTSFHSGGDYHPAGRELGEDSHDGLKTKLKAKSKAKWGSVRNVMKKVTSKASAAASFAKKGDFSMEAIVKAAVLKRIPSPFRGLFVTVLPNLLKGKFVKAANSILPLIKWLVLEPLYDWFGFSTVQIECAARRYLTAIANSDYKVAVFGNMPEKDLLERKITKDMMQWAWWRSDGNGDNTHNYPGTGMTWHPPDDGGTIKGKTLPLGSPGVLDPMEVEKPNSGHRPTSGWDAHNLCKAQKFKYMTTGGGFGPLEVTFKRYEREVFTKHSKIGQKFPSSEKAVCEFTFKFDTFRCTDRYMTGPGFYRSNRMGSVKNSCCSKHTWASPRYTSSVFNASKQTQGHDCKQWYMGMITIVQAYMSIYTSLWNQFMLKKCLDDNTCSSKCDEMKNGKPAPGSCKATPGCRYMYSLHFLFPLKNLILICLSLMSCRWAKGGDEPQSGVPRPRTKKSDGKWIQEMNKDGMCLGETIKEQKYLKAQWGRPKDHWLPGSSCDVDKKIWRAGKRTKYAQWLKHMRGNGYGGYFGFKEKGHPWVSGKPSKPGCPACNAKFKGLRAAQCSRM